VTLVAFVGADAGAVGHHVGDVVLLVDGVDQVGEGTLKQNDISLKKSSTH
jgi:hypothetical protein